MQNLLANAQQNLLEMNFKLKAFKIFMWHNLAMPRYQDPDPSFLQAGVLAPFGHL